MAAADQRRLADGRAIVLRPAGPGDVAAITRLYLSLSRQSFARRFHSGRPAADLVAGFAALGSGTFSLVAAPPADPGALAAEARYVPVEPGTAELALTVQDSYQGTGLGHLLLDALARQAGQDGFGRLRAFVLLENAPMLRLLEHYGWVLAAPVEDYTAAYLDIATDGGMPGWPPGSAGRRVLVERRGWFDDQQVTALRAAGQDIRQCAGPLRQAGRACPLLTSGTCRLAEEADQILSLLPPGDPDCAAVRAAHQRRWPHKMGG